MLEVSMKNQQRRSKHPSLQQWHSSSRLNSMFHSAASIKPEETEKIALMQRYRQAIKPTVARFDKKDQKDQKDVEAHQPVDRSSKARTLRRHWQTGAALGQPCRLLVKAD